MIKKHVPCSVPRILEKSEFLFHEGDDSDYVYYVHKGFLDVFTEINGERKVLGVIESGEFVGELGVLQNIKRNANVVARETVHITQYDLTAFIEIISSSSENSMRLVHTLSCRSRKIALLSEQILEQLGGYKPELSCNPLSMILKVSEHCLENIKKLIYRRWDLLHKNPMPEKLENGIYTVRKNDVLLREGQDSHYACKVISGKFKALKKIGYGYQRVGFIHPGEYIGEMGLLEGAPRSLSVVAVEDARVEVYDEDAFIAMMCADAHHCYELITHLSRRATKLNEHLKEMMWKHATVLDGSLLKHARQLLENIGDVSLLTGQMIEEDLDTLRVALKQEAVAVGNMMETYYRYIAGKAGKQEMEYANAEFRNFLKTLSLGALIIIPGSFITIPLVVKIAKSRGIDIFSKSRLNKKEISGVIDDK